MTTSIVPTSAVTPTSISEVRQLAEIAVKSGILSPEIRSPEAAVVILLAVMAISSLLSFLSEADEKLSSEELRASLEAEIINLKELHNRIERLLREAEDKSKG
jgi:hypothetical protein